MNYKFTILLAFLLSIGIKGNTIDFKPDHVEKRTYNWTYNVLENALFEIDNKYGNVNITTWDQNTIEINVTVTYGHWDKEIAKEKINCIKIKTSATQSYVTATTEFNCDLSVKGNHRKSNNDLGVKINYEVKIPSYGNLIARNKYGNIILGTIGGNTNIHLKYGTLIANTLKSNSNILDLSYSKGTHIQLVNNLNIEDADYSDITINGAKTIHFNSDYTDIKIDKVEQILSSSMDYGNLEVNEVNCLTFSADYSNLKINLLHECLNLDMSYGSYKINQTSDQFHRIHVIAAYSSGKVKVNPNASFKTHTLTKYSDTYLSPNIKIKQHDKSHTSEEINAEYNASGCMCSTVHIESKYGNIKIETTK
ncbi:hypothetical protein UJ101_00642 [Flavobacteriaceae bacterium UJ101]|nr:hypothetical protein UJ101_00642 [Flavobacteriaceae bacterium UJ101]